MPLLVVAGLVAPGLVLVLLGLSRDTSAGAALTSGGIGVMVTTVMFAVAGRLRK
jgi:hypothetical protein